MSIIKSLMMDHPSPPRQIDPTLPEAFSDLVEDLLAKDPADRPKSAQAIARILEAIAADKTTALQVVPSTRMARSPEKTAGGGKRKPPPRSSARLWVLLSAGTVVLVAGILALLLAFDVIQISSPKGTLVIETNDPAVKVIVKQGGAVIVDPTSKRQIELKPGDYEIELAEAKEGLRLLTKKFTLSRNGREVVKVHFEPVKIQTPAGAIKRRHGRYYSIHGADDATYQTWIAELERTGYRPIFLNAATIQGRTLFASIAVKNEFVIPWEARHNLGSGKYQDVFEEMTPKGLRPVSVTGYLVGDALRFGALWVKDGKPLDWWAHHNLTKAKLQAAIEEHNERGLQPMYLSGYSDGISNRFSSIFTNEKAPWVTDQDLTEAQYVEAFQKYAKQGFRLSSISGYGTGDQARFAYVFVKDKRYQTWISEHNLTREDYEKMAERLSAKDYYPLVISTYAWGGSLRYATIWVKDWPKEKCPPPWTFEVGRTRMSVLLQRRQGLSSLPYLQQGEPGKQQSSPRPQQSPPAWLTACVTVSAQQGEPGKQQSNPRAQQSELAVALAGQQGPSGQQARLAAQQSPLSQQGEPTTQHAAPGEQQSLLDPELANAQAAPVPIRTATAATTNHFVRIEFLHEKVWIVSTYGVSATRHKRLL